MFRLGVDSAHYASTFAKGVNEGFSLGENAKKGAFLAGVQIGQQLAGQMIPGITMEVFGENGTLMKKRVELIKPIQTKVFAAIEKYAKEQGFDLVLDKASNASILYYGQAIDHTEKIIEELTK